MRTILTFIPIILIFILSGCSKNQKPSNTEETGVETPTAVCKIDKYDFVDSTEEALVYDTLNRLINLVKIQNNRKEEIDFTYDSDGKLVQIFDKEGLEYELYQYDKVGNLVKEFIYDDTITENNLKEYQLHQYDNKNLRIATTYYEITDENKGGIAREIDQYTYDTLGNIIEISTELVLEKKKYVEAKYEYLNKRNNYTYPLAYSYSPGQNLISKFTLFGINGKPTSIYTYKYEFNEKGNPTKVLTLKEKLDTKGKNIGTDTTSVLSVEYINCK